MLTELLFFVYFGCFLGYSNPIPPPKDLQNIKPDFKVTKFTYSRDNDTDVMDQEQPDFQLIPLDFLCEFCQIVILKLKERQATEDDFEQKIRSECLNSTDDSSSLCDVINRVNLDRLKNDDPKDICQSQNMCNGGLQEPGPPATSPQHSMDGSVKESDSEVVKDSEDAEIGKHLTIDETNVNATLHVEDVAPPY